MALVNSFSCPLPFQGFMGKISHMRKTLWHLGVGRRMDKESWDFLKLLGRLLLVLVCASGSLYQVVVLHRQCACFLGSSGPINHWGDTLLNGQHTEWTSVTSHPHPAPVCVHQNLWMWPCLEIVFANGMSLRWGHTGLGRPLNPNFGVLIRRERKTETHREEDRVKMDAEAGIMLP